MKNTATYLGAWLLAAGLALAFAVAAPSETRVMGTLPTFMSQTLTRQPVAVADGLPSERTLALITFQPGQHAQIESWIRGLNLRNDPSISWMRVAVRNDPGTPTARTVLETRMLNRFPVEAERARFVPVYTDPASFARSMGLTSINQVSVVVVNRQGDVLARVEGKFDAEKARALRETLKTKSL